MGEASGDGRDFIVFGQQEYRGGKQKALPPLTASLGRQCHPRPRPYGPKPRGQDMMRNMNQGLWQPTGEFTGSKTVASVKALPRSGSAPATVLASNGAPRGYMDSMAAWEEGLKPNLLRNPNLLKTWSAKEAMTETRAGGPNCGFGSAYSGSGVKCGVRFDKNGKPV